MTKKRTAFHPKRALLRPEIEYHLVQCAQEGNKDALKCLGATYIWFMKQIADVYTPEKATEDERIRYWDHIVCIFAETTLTLPLEDESACLLEQVLDRTAETFGAPIRKKRLKKVKTLLSLKRLYVLKSLDEPLGDDTETTRGDMTQGCVGPSHEQQIWETQLREAIAVWCTQLSPLEQRIVGMAHGAHEMTLSEIASQLGTTLNRVQGRYNKALRKLRDIVPNDFRISD